MLPIFLHITGIRVLSCHFRDSSYLLSLDVAAANIVCKDFYIFRILLASLTRPQWPRGLRLGSAAAGFLGLWV